MGKDHQLMNQFQQPFIDHLKHRKYLSASPIHMAALNDYLFAAQDPVGVMNEDGADAMRLYLTTSSVVHGDNLAFNRLGIQDVITFVILLWYNANKILGQNALRHQSETETIYSTAKV